MNTTNIKTGLVAAAAAMLFTATAAEAAKISDFRFHVATTQFDELPTMEMAHEGGAWKWVSQGKNFNIRIKVLIKSVGNRFEHAGIIVERNGFGLWSMPDNYKTFKYEKLEHTTIGKTLLTSWQNDAKALCDVFGGDKKVVRDMEIPLKGWAHLNADTYNAKNILPVKVVCLAKPKAPARVPVAFKVNEVKLYTIPAKPVCGKPVRLVAEFHANKPGKASFVLQRRDGEQQGATIDIGQTASGAVKRWSKEYLYNSSIKREYQIIVPGHPILTPWVAVEVKCGAGVDVKRPGGFAIPPRPSR